MTLRKLALVAALALACAPAALAQTASTLAVKDANATARSLAGQADASSNFHYRDVLEGLTSGGAPDPVLTDGAGHPLFSLYGGLPLPAGAATAAGVGAIVTALGTPLQAGGNVAVTASALPTGASTSALQTSGNASLTGIQASEAANTFFTPTTTALGASAIYTGPTRDVGVAAGTGTAVSYFNVVFYADQAGTAYIDLSDDGSTWTPAVAGTALTAATPLTLTAPLLARYYRARLVNGSTAETVMRVSSAFSRN